LLDPPARRGGQRRYSPTVLQRLAVIELGQRAGFTITEIRELLAGTTAGAASERWRALAQRKLPEIRALIQRAKEMERWLEEGLRCDCLRLEDCRLVADRPATASTPPEQ
jgi:MerR family redox-sensitive transcriptional activator SoxR